MHGNLLGKIPFIFFLFLIWPQTLNCICTTAIVAFKLFAVIDGKMVIAFFCKCEVCRPLIRINRWPLYNIFINDWYEGGFIPFIDQLKNHFFFIPRSTILKTQNFRMPVPRLYILFFSKKTLVNFNDVCCYTIF